MPLALDPWAATTLGAFTSRGGFDPWARLSLGVIAAPATVLIIGDGHVELVVDEAFVEAFDERCTATLADLALGIWLLEDEGGIVLPRSGESVQLTPRRPGLTIEEMEAAASGSSAADAHAAGGAAQAEVTPEDTGAHE